MNTRLGFFALLVSGIIYSTFGILIRFAGESFGTFTQVLFRCLATVVIAFSIALIRKKKLILPKDHPGIMALFLLSPSLSIACLTFAISMIKAANGLFFLYAGYILTTTICGALFYKEKLNTTKIIALLLAASGIFLFSYPFESASVIGLTFAILAGILDALSSTVCKRLGSGDSIPLIFYRYLVGTVLAFIAVILVHESILTIPTITSVAAVIILGASLFVIDSLWLYGFSHFDLNLGSIVTSIELVIAPIINAIVLYEYPTSFEVLGGVFIICAILVINMSVIKVHQVKVDNQRRNT